MGVKDFILMYSGMKLKYTRLLRYLRKDIMYPWQNLLWTAPTSTRKEEKKLLIRRSNRFRNRKR